MHILILGNGVSGVTCARYLRKYTNHDISIVSDESDEFFSRTALMYVYMGHMRLRDTMPYESWFWQKNRINCIRARIEHIDFQNKTLKSTEGKTLSYDKLVLALGSLPNKIGWPGQDLDGVQGLYHLPDLEQMERHSARLLHSGERAVVVGGGLIGVEMAEMFHSRGIPVTFLVREKAFWNNVIPLEESQMIGRHLQTHHIDLRFGAELSALHPGPGGSTVGSITTSTGETIPCGFVGLTIGVSPNIAFLQNTSLETNRGILVDDYLQTNLPDVYAIGDCAEIRRPQPGRRAIEAVWYTGRMMGEALAATLSGTPTPYRPGHWFNSAKFFDIECQVYGNVPAQLPEHQDTIYWEHPRDNKTIRINYERESGRVTGFNLMGVRYRHAVCERWLQEGAHIHTVLENLGMANFDPEFSSEYEAEVVAMYNRRRGQNIQLRQKRGLPAVQRFLKNILPV